MAVELRLSRCTVVFEEPEAVGVRQADGTFTPLARKQAKLLHLLREMGDRGVSERVAKAHGCVEGTSESILHLAIHRLRRAIFDAEGRHIVEDRIRSVYVLHAHEDAPLPDDGRGRVTRRVRDAALRNGWPLDGVWLTLDGQRLELERLLAWPKRVTELPRYQRLPPLLGSDVGMPIDSMYVELALSAGARHPNPEVLGLGASLAEALAARRERRRAVRRTVRDVLDHPRDRLVVFLGDPGSGKSSLLRRVTLEIARGEHPRWCLPLPVHLPAWWSATRGGGRAVDPVRFALLELLTGSAGRREVEALATDGALAARIDAFVRLLEQVAGPKREGVLVLCDALDELAGHPDALAAATEAVRAIAARFGCVVASRPAGYFRGLEEDACYELMELEDDGIETLVARWFDHLDPPVPAARGADALLSQLGANPRLHEMARNPFLLTLLCQLHLDASSRDAGGADAALPLLRSGVYARILTVAHREAAARTGDPACFDAEARRHLAAFCRWLHAEAPRHPRHLFDEDDWAGFRPPAPSLGRVAAARVLTRWSGVGDYHVVHMTIHEFLVAAAVAGDVEALIAHRHARAWREVLRFSGAILGERGDVDALRRLLTALLTPPELLGRTTLDAAWILLDAGIEDTTALLGRDLREELWATWAASTPFLAEAAAEALGILAPAWLFRRVVDAVETGAGLGTLQRWRPLELLARVRTPAAEDYLLRALEGHDTDEGWLRGDDPDQPRSEGFEARAADEALEALIEVNTRRVRARLLEIVVRARASLRVRVCRFADETRGAAFLPWLHERLDEAQEPERSRALSAIAAIASPDSVPRLLAWAAARPEARDVVAGRALARLYDELRDPRLADTLRLWFEDAIGRARRARRGGDVDELREEAVGSGLVGEERLAALLRHPSSREQILRAVAFAAESSRIDFGDRILATIERLSDEGDDDAFEAVCRTRACRRHAGRDPGPLDRVRDGLASPSEERRMVAADVLGALEDRVSRDALLARATDPDESVGVRNNALSSLAHLGLPSGGGRELLARVGELVTGGDEAVAHAAAMACLLLAPAFAGRFRHLPCMRSALALWCGNNDVLVFDDGWVDRHGRANLWEM